MGLDPAFLGPWQLPPNRVTRFYRGGALLESFRAGTRPTGDATTGDGTLPEDWVGSATRAWTPPEAPLTTDGLGYGRVDGTTRAIDELLRFDPAAVAGATLVEQAGPTLGVLVKLLDAGVRLPVHAHPSRAFARRWLGSFFGKAEAWIVVATRDTGDPEGPSVRIGFRRDQPREDLIDLIADERTETLLDAMHFRRTAPGDVWFIPPGVPHAIGAGVFMVEIEEPSDFSIVTETRDIPIHPAHAHLGLGWEVAVDAIDRTGHDEAWLDGLRHDGRRGPIDAGGCQRRPLTDVAADPFFRAEHLTVTGRGRPDLESPGFLVGVVLSGSGSVRAGGRELAIERGGTFAVPAAVSATLELASSDEREPLEVIACLGPRPEDLAGSGG